tara:strand:+ start:276 stop:632 length:357 start_codon:yes stop_codon:yes gene_type:complete
MGKITFGAPDNMPEVPKGETATFKLGKPEDWVIEDTEWGEKFTIPIVLFSHPSFESISKKGIPMQWQSKSVAAKSLYYWMYNEEDVLKIFDVDMSDELNALIELTRLESGKYRLTINT